MRVLGGRQARRHFPQFIMLAAFALALHPVAARATLLTVDQFKVGRSGSVIFNDTFASTTTLSGGSGTILSSGVNFTGTGTTANYIVRGTVQEATPNNGQAMLNTATGPITPQPPPFYPAIQETNVTLGSGMLTSQPFALTPSVAFSVTGLFDLSVPSVPGGTTGLLLTNRYATNGFAGNVLQLRLRNCAPGVLSCGTNTGLTLQLIWLDYINNAASVINQFELSAAQLLSPQLKLSFSKAAGSDNVTGCYGFGTGDTLGTFSGTGGCLGTTGSATDIFTSSLQTTLGGFIAFEPVSVAEPSSLALIASGLLMLGCLAWWRRTVRA